MKHSILLIISMATFYSCSRNSETPISPKPVPMSFTASIESELLDADTKTTLDGNPSASVRKTLWCPSDSIYVTNGTSASKFINTETTTTGTAHFDGEIATGKTYYAAYPYQIVSGFSSGSFVIELPSEQPYFEDGISSDYYPMVAMSSDGAFNFRNLCGILVLQLTGSETVASITFTGKNSKGQLIPVSGKGSVGVYTDLWMDSDAGTSVKLNCSEGVILNSTTPTTFHIVLPPATFTTCSISITNTKGEVIHLNGMKPLTTKRSSRVTAAAVDADFEFEDLSIAGTANCYLVTEARKYKFKAVKGNSSESVGTISSVSVLWESYGTDETIATGDLIKADVSYADNYITFTTGSQFPAKKGNAVIAAKDAGGNILWSWHIWLTDQPSVQSYRDKAGTMMDRNLGATSATPGDVHALGLLYQWGRKDPFLGADSRYYSSNPKQAASTGTWESATESTASTGTFEYAVQHPMQFITWNTNNYDWHYSTASYTDKTRWQTSDKTKGLYDPCPVGWRVPDGGDSGVWCTAFGTTIDWKTKSNWDERMGMDFGYTDKRLVISGECWYPGAGRRNPNTGSLNNVGTSGYYWSCTPHSTLSTRLYSLCFNDSGYVYPVYSYEAALGWSVRCLKDTKN